MLTIKPRLSQDMRTHVWQEEQKRKERYTKASITESLVLDIPSFRSFWYNLFPLRLDPCLPGHNERAHEFLHQELVHMACKHRVWSDSWTLGMHRLHSGWVSLYGRGGDQEEVLCFAVQMLKNMAWSVFCSCPSQTSLFEQILRVWDLSIHCFEAKLLPSL